MDRTESPSLAVDRLLSFEGLDERSLDLDLDLDRLRSLCFSLGAAGPSLYLNLLLERTGDLDRRLSFRLLLFLRESGDSLRRLLLRGGERSRLDELL